MKRTICFLAAWSLLHSIAGCSYFTEAPPRVSTDPLPVLTEPEAESTAAATVTDPEPEDTQLVRVTDWVPTVREALAYATTNNFTSRVIYDFEEGYLRYGTVKKLSMVCDALAEHGMGLILWDGYRPLEAQAMLWEICPDPGFVSHPVTGTRTHCRGNAVDVALYDLATGQPLPVPTGFDNFTSYADRDYSDCGTEAADNARLLEQIMEKYGFRPYFAEWWHFTDTEDYPVEEAFYPGTPALWTANCREYISLWASPGGELLRTIPKGAEMTLLGWDGVYARVRCGDREGCVNSSYILPKELPALLPDPDCAACYSYETMMKDLQALADAYPGRASLSTIGTSAHGRQIPVLRIGHEAARHHVLFQGAIHGREHMTAWLLTALAGCWLERGVSAYGDVCVHIIPMANPDGVAISQTKTLSEAQREIYEKDCRADRTTAEEAEYASLWKANGEGVDLNRNFSAGWGDLDARTGPSSQQYRGSSPFSAPEAAALRDYTLGYPLDATVSYHASGSLIYYAYGRNDGVNQAALSLARAVEAVTGYPPQEGSGLEGGGYKDWAMDALQIPSLTVEVGCGAAPLDQREACSLLSRNYRVLPAILRWLQNR